VPADEARILAIGKLAQKIAPVVVESDHERVIGLGQPVQQQTARIVMVDIGVPYRRKRRDCADRRIPRAGEEVAGGDNIGDAGCTEPAVGPRLGDNPIGNAGVVVALSEGTEAVTRAETGAGAAHIDRDQRIASRHEQVAPALLRQGMPRLPRARQLSAQTAGNTG
jgi:hypothetical protein